MNRKVFQALLWLMWLALPLTAFRYWQAWDRLPLRMATHFDSNWRSNGWMPRETALYFALGVTAFLLVVFTVVGYVAHKTHVPDAAAWALLGFFYLVTSFVCVLNSRVVQFNLDGQPLRIDSWIVLIPVALFALAAVFLGAKRGATLPAGSVIAEETHASPAWSLLFIALLVAEVSAAIAVPVLSVRIALGLVSLLFAMVAAHTWTGFRYFFSSAGVEIRTLGFRLRSIPRDQIKQYAVESWSPLRGYGIRGVGNRRAYVWGNTGVRIVTAEGEVFLGHSEPERIVRDLDSIRLKQARATVLPR
jgi:hypothetical protein